MKIVRAFVVTRKGKSNDVQNVGAMVHHRLYLENIRFLLFITFFYLRRPTDREALGQKLVNNVSIFMGFFFGFYWPDHSASELFEEMRNFLRMQN